MNYITIIPYEICCKKLLLVPRLRHFERPPTLCVTVDLTQDSVLSGCLISSNWKFLDLSNGSIHSNAVNRSLMTGKSISICKSRCFVGLNSITEEYADKMSAHLWSWPAAKEGTPCLCPSIVVSGLWSVTLPYRYWWNFCPSYTSAKASFYSWK